MAKNQAAIAIRNYLVLALAFASGYIDALSYLGLGSVFTSNMTGNTVLLGLAIGEGRGLAAARSAVALVAYVAGVAVGSTVVSRDTKRPIWPSSATAAFAFEFVVLLLFAAGGGLAGPTPSDLALYSLILLAAIAMGIQSAAVRVLGVSGVATTYITGTWTSLVSGLTKKLASSVSGSERDSGLQMGSTAIQAAVVFIYIIAAISGGLAYSTWGLSAAFVPPACVATVVVAAYVRFRRQ